MNNNDGNSYLMGNVEHLHIEPDQRFMDALKINPPPEKLEQSAPVFSFSRNRDVEVPWKDILDGLNTSGATSIAAIQHYFESAWKLDANDPAQIAQLAKGDRAAIVAAVLPPEPESDAQPNPDTTFYRTEFNDDNNPVAHLVEGVVARHSSGRFYQLLAMDGDKPLKLTDFSAKNYATTWQEKVQGIELVFHLAEEATSFYTDFSELDLRPVIIERRFKELQILKQFSTEVGESVKSATTQKIAMLASDYFDPQELDELQNKSLQLQMRVHDVQRQLERLKTQAGDLGFVLFLDNDNPLEKPADFPDAEKEKKITPGKLYTSYSKTVKWTVSATRPLLEVPNVFAFIPIPITIGLWAASKLISVPYRKPREHTFTAYKEVNTSIDLLGNSLRELRQQGFEPFVFDRTPAGLMSSDGTSLRSIMARCRNNEAFRRKCAVLLPVFEESFTGKRILTKYSVFKRPLPGISPSMLPRLSLQESLSYRTIWKGSELGELANSINLAPGEERTITVTKSFQRETVVSESTTSIFEIAQSESTDLSSEMESQASRENENSSHWDASAKVSGQASGGFWSASGEASASGGGKASLKSFNQSVNKVAKNAAQSINQKNKQEVSSESQTKTTVANTETTVAKIRNINEGRSLNLMFYRLYNRYQSGLYLDGLQFEVIPGVEIIAGSSVYEAVQFNLSDVKGMLTEFDQTQLPFDLDPAERNRYRHRVLTAFYDLLDEEYRLKEKSKENSAKTRKPAAKTFSIPDQGNSVELLNIPPASKDVIQPAEKQMRDDARVEKRVAGLSRWLSSAPIVNSAIENTELTVLSRGLYLDSFVGTRPSTEPYFEEMRMQEVRMRAAEVQKTESDAYYQRAQASRLATLSSVNWLTGYLPDPDANTLTLSLELPLQPGNWVVTVNGNELVTIDSKWNFKRVITLDLPATRRGQKNLLNQSEKLGAIELFEKDTQALISFVG